MIEGFFLDGVDTKTAGTTIGGQYHGLPQPATNKTQTALAIMQLAKTWTEITLDAILVYRVPVVDRFGRGRVDGKISHNDPK